MKTAKVFMSGGSQAVRLPKEYRFDCDELVVNKVGHMITSVPRDKALNSFIDGMDGFTDDFVEAVRAYLRRKGTPIGTMDMLIAAHAKSPGLVLVTNNVREFERVPWLNVENWAERAPDTQ